MSRPPSPSQSIQDPTTRWEQIRAQWLKPSTSANTLETNSSSTDDDPDSTIPTISSSSTIRRKPKDVVFSQRIKTLEQMLRAANAGETPLSAAAGGVPTLLEAPLSPKGKERELDMEEPDDGFAVGGEKKGSTQELKKISEGIFLAFKQGRALKEALPLSLVTSLLFRSWLIDGTIPGGYCRSQAEPDPPMPIPLSTSSNPNSFPPHLAPSIPSSTLSNLDDQSTTAPSAATPSPLTMLSEINPKAVTPLPSGAEDNATTEGGIEIGEGETGCTNTPDEGTPTKDQDSESMPPPPLPLLQALKKPGVHPLQSPSASSSGGGGGSGSTASLEGMGADETSGKLKLDVLRGSRWRTERDVASGSDII